MPWEMRCFHLGLKLRGGYYPPLRAPGGGITPFTPPLNTRLPIIDIYKYRRICLGNGCISSLMHGRWGTKMRSINQFSQSGCTN